MIGNLFNLGDNARVVTTVTCVPVTLYHTPGGTTWLQTKIHIGGQAVGESHAHDFTKEEKDQLDLIIQSVLNRHHQKIQSYGS